VHDQGVAAFLQVFRHAAPHDAKTDEANFHFIALVASTVPVRFG